MAILKVCPMHLSVATNSSPSCQPKVFCLANWKGNSAYGLGALALVAVLRWQSSRRTRPTPPGPTKFPVVGSILSMPTSRQWEVLRDWEKEYGELIYLEGLGQKILAVNSFPLAQTLLSSRAANYSDRGWGPLIDLIDFNWSFANMSYGALWRDYRRAFHQLLNQSQVPQYSHIIVNETVRFLQRLLLDKKKFRKDINILYGSVIMRISYGSDNIEYNKELIQETQKFGHDFMEYSAPGKLLVSTFPSLQYLPSWFPGTGWKQPVEALRSSSGRVRSKPYIDLKQRMREGIQGDYNVGEQLIAALPNEDDPAYRYEDDLAQNVAAINFLGKLEQDTTVSSALALILALAMHPEVQKKAQKEIETAVGPERVPSFEDLERLPYIQAIVKEVSRWHTVIPLGVPHAATNNDDLNGYRIPCWAIMHDPNVFEDPMEFKPERYFKDGKLNKDLLDPMDVAFGYGRRICPGLHLSNAGLAMMVASMLAFFDVKQVIGPDGKPIPLKYEFESDSSLFVLPAPFDCDIVPRSTRHAQIVQTLIM
ncbi:cytochrome P450 [Coprinopsis sp. MPI-PUGE-AT-0042]|nr:cytochrome P450 [Coprinopsis sp. MPI-PUGE-AT-0042]